MSPPERELPARGAAREQVAAEACAVDAPASAAESLLETIRRGAGNALVSRYVIARQPDGGAPDATAPRTAADPEAELTAAEQFVEHGPYHGDVTPGAAGSEGGFEAVYTPTDGKLEIKMRVAVNFKDAIDSSLTPFDPALTPLVTRARRLRGDRRRRFLAQYQWPGAADAPERVQWKTNLKTLIDDRWGGKFEFHLNKPQWEWVGAHVVVDIDVHDGPKAANDHLALDAVKFPEGQNMYSFNDDPENVAANRSGASFTEPGTGADAHDQHMVLASTDIGARPDFNVLRESVSFGAGSSTLDTRAQGFLNDWIATFNGSTGDRRSVNQQVTLEAHTSATGTTERNDQLAQDRANAVRDYLSTHGFTNIATRVTTNPRGAEGAHGGEDARDRRVDLVVGSGAAQELAVHEFGHAFGLDDEYADTPHYKGSGATVGSAASHDPAVKAMQDEHGDALPGAIHETTDSIMSAGNVIRPQHYSMFHKALGDITHQSPWALGAPSAKPAHTPDPNAPHDAGVPLPAGVP